MKRNILKPGTCIQVLKWLGLVRHQLMYVGPRGPNGEDVIHNQPGRGVRWDFLSDVARGQEARISAPAPEATWEQEATVRRMISQVGQPYDLATNNCEHVTWFGRFGKRVSMRVVYWFFAILALVGCALFFPEVVRRKGFWPAAILVAVLGAFVVLPWVSMHSEEHV